ncbi:LEA14-like dessication related protein [Gammaproteobacteria bacterium]
MNAHRSFFYLFSLIALISCTNQPSTDFSNLKQPKINLIGLKLHSLSLAEQKLLVKLQIENPNDQGFSVAGVDLSVSLNGKEFAKGNTTTPLSLVAQGSSTVEVEASANVLGVLEQGVFFLQKKSIDYQVSGHLSVLPGVFSWVKLPLSYSGTVTLQQLQQGIELMQGLKH